MNKILIILLLILIGICTFLLIENKTVRSMKSAAPNIKIDFIYEIPAPSGYKQISYKKHSFSRWLQHLPLKNNKKIISHRKKEIALFYNIFAVVDMPLLFKGNVEQCADYCMRFWAEYHKDHNKLSALYLYSYTGIRRYFARQHLSYKKFLFKRFLYSNSYSLKRGCEKILKNESLIVGDMFVQNKKGGIGHVSLIVNICKNKSGKKLYLIGFSFMPAQEFHIEYAEEKYGTAGWFSYAGYISYLKKHFPFGKPVLRRF